MSPSQQPIAAFAILFIMLGSLGCRSAIHSEPISVVEVLRSAVIQSPSTPEEVIVDVLGLRLPEISQLCLDLIIEAPVYEHSIPIALPLLSWRSPDEYLEIIKPNGKKLNLPDPGPSLGCSFGPPTEGYSIVVANGRRRIFLQCSLPMTALESLGSGLYRVRLLDNSTLQSLHTPCRVNTSWREFKLLRASLLHVPEIERPSKPQMYVSGIGP